MRWPVIHTALNLDPGALRQRIASSKFASQGAVLRMAEEDLAPNGLPYSRLPRSSNEWTGRSLLLASLPAAIALDLCCCTDLGTPSTLPSLAHAVPAVPEARRLLLRQLAEEKEALALPSALVAALGFGTGV